LQKREFNQKGAFGSMSSPAGPELKGFCLLMISSSPLENNYEFNGQPRTKKGFCLLMMTA
jgi:hypothetical protein